jgi:hypothetical protein
MLGTALVSAVRATENESLYQPQRNVFTIFTCPWHVEFSSLTDADLANAWRLADLMALDRACVACIVDTVVQRAVRARKLSPLLAEGQTAAVVARVAEVQGIIDGLDGGRWDVAAGIAAPDPGSAGSGRLATAARWGHVAALRDATSHLTSLSSSAAGTGACAAASKRTAFAPIQATCSGGSWVEAVALAAIEGGQLAVLQWLLEEARAVTPAQLLQLTRTSTTVAAPAATPTVSTSNQLTVMHWLAEYTASKSETNTAANDEMALVSLCNTMGLV